MKILLLTTGGTIASVASEQGYVAALPGEKLLETCSPTAGQRHEIQIVDVFSKDSSNINPADWLTVARSIRENARAQDAAVVLHGTDTLAWTAAALSFLLHDITVPVVLTGSMLPPETPENDVADNIRSAFQFAALLAERGQAGVSVSFAGALIHGTKATKINSRRKEAFAGVDYPLLGETQSGVACLTSHIPRRSARRPWGEQPLFETDIALIPLFPGMKAAFLDALTEQKPRAVVLEGYGLGGIPFTGENLLPSIERGIRTGIPFVLRTQSPFGGTDPAVYEVGQNALSLGVLSACDMTRESLVTKLMLLLPVLGNPEGRRQKFDNLKRRLYENLCDEITGGATEEMRSNHGLQNIDD